MPEPTKAEGDLGHEVRDGRVGERLAEVTRSLVGLHRRYYGRGATRAKAFLVHDDLLLVEMRDIFLTVEATLLAKGQEDAVRATRTTFHSAMRDEFVSAVERALDRHVVNYETVVCVYPSVAFELFVLEGDVDRAPRLVREQEEDDGLRDRPLGGVGSLGSD